MALLAAGGGVDLFIVETMSDAREMALVVSACREAARKAQRDIPVAASMAFDPSKQGGFRTSMGVSALAKAAQAMVEAGADIIGANCGSVTPEQMAEIVREFRSVTKRHPNPNPAERRRAGAAEGSDGLPACARGVRGRHAQGWSPRARNWSAAAAGRRRSISAVCDRRYDCPAPSTNPRFPSAS